MKKGAAFDKAFDKVPQVVLCAQRPFARGVLKPKRGEWLDPPGGDQEPTPASSFHGQHRPSWNARPRPLDSVVNFSQ